MHFSISLRRRFRAGASLAACILMSGCASLPNSGPTGGAVRKAAAAPESTFPYTLVDVTNMAALPPPPARTVPTLVEARRRSTDLLGVGDLVNITVYEAGVTLFNGPAVTGDAAAIAGTSMSGAPGVSLAPGSSAARLPTQRVDDSGFIRIPFVGQVRAAGRTTSQLQSAIQAGLRGKSQSPQVIVTVQDSLSNSVIIGGEVARPGRLTLSTNRETLADAIALGGGYRGEAKDAVARVQRNGGTFEMRLSDLLDAPAEDIRVAPGDRITVLSKPQTFSALGAASKNEEITFSRSNLSLAQAVALAGGTNPDRGDASAVFVFRMNKTSDGQDRPTVYSLNMLQPGAYLLAQRFTMRDRDVLFVGNAGSNQLTKFVSLLSQLFIPVATVRNTVQ